MTTFIQNDNLQSLAVIQRPHELLNKTKINTHPFISSVTTNLNPIGLPPIVNRQKIKKIKKESKISKKNKRVIENLEKLKKIEKETEVEEKQQESEKFNKIKERRNIINDEINRLRAKNDKAHEKINNEENIHDLIEQVEQNKEEKDLLYFMEGLNFEKYLKDLEIREALKLIKLKVEEDNNTNDKDIGKNNEENIDLQKSQTIVTLPPINTSNKEVNIIPVVHNKDWNVR